MKQCGINCLPLTGHANIPGTAAPPSVAMVAFRAKLNFKQATYAISTEAFQSQLNDLFLW